MLSIVADISSIWAYFMEIEALRNVWGEVTCKTIEMSCGVNRGSLLTIDA